MTEVLQATASVRHGAPHSPPCGPRRARHRLRRYWHEPALCVQTGGRFRRNAVTRDHHGIVSLILWVTIMIISVKYAILIMRADNRGEGGIVALLALLDARHAPPGTWRASLLVVGLIGAALLYGDGVITPAISVLSAVEGLKIDAPQLAPMVVPVSVLILIGLFLVQRKGTGFIGNIFGPTMLLWFTVIGVLGLCGIFRAPAILVALSPFSAVSYLFHAGPGIGFAVLGAAFLAVTGGEAMYADMGHFGRLPIRLGWFAVVLPCLVMNYFGQGALLLSDPTAIATNPFYLLGPRWAHYPMVAFATVATIIASQAIISGCLFPHPAIHPAWISCPACACLHTASQAMGQIYTTSRELAPSPSARSEAVLAFGSSDALGVPTALPFQCSWRSRPCLLPRRATMGLQPVRRPGGKRTVPHRRSDVRRGQRNQADRGRLVSTFCWRAPSRFHADLAHRMALA